jgi:hypothetical protein
MGLVLKLVKKLGLISKILPALIKAIGDGQFGEPVRKLYWAAAGYKTITGATIWLIAEGLTIYGSTGYCPDCATWLPYVQRASEVLILAGLADAAVREHPPVPPATGADKA